MCFPQYLRHALYIPSCPVFDVSRTFRPFPIQFRQHPLPILFWDLATIKSGLGCVPRARPYLFRGSLVAFLAGEKAMPRLNQAGVGTR